MGRIVLRKPENKLTVGASTYLGKPCTAVTHIHTTVHLRSVVDDNEIGRDGGEEEADWEEGGQCVEEVVEGFLAPGQSKGDYEKECASTFLYTVQLING